MMRSRKHSAVNPAYARGIEIRKLKLLAASNTEMDWCALGTSCVNYGINHNQIFNLGISNLKILEALTIVEEFAHPHGSFKRISLFLDFVMFLENQSLFYDKTLEILDRIAIGDPYLPENDKCLEYPLEGQSMDKRIANCKSWFRLSDVYKGQDFQPPINGDLDSSTFVYLNKICDYCSTNGINLDLIFNPIHSMHMLWLTHHFGSKFTEWYYLIQDYTGPPIQSYGDDLEALWLDPCHWTELVGQHLLDSLPE